MTLLRTLLENYHPTFSPEEAVVARDFILTGDLPNTPAGRAAYDVLYDLLFSRMPHGTATGDTSTFDEWVSEYFANWNEADVDEFLQRHTR